MDLFVHSSGPFGGPFFVWGGGGGSSEPREPPLTLEYVNWIQSTSGHEASSNSPMDVNRVNLD